MSDVVVIGGGQAGSSLVSRLRSKGFDGKITLICGEADLPYQRPPLSKAYLLGEMERERLYLRPDSYYAEQKIEVLCGTPVTAIDRTAKTVSLGDRSIPYDMLALTTGSVPRRLPATIGGDLGNVFTVRGLADVDAMAPEMQAGRHVLIVGGGYIGLEAAAVAAKMGLNVTLVELSDRILQRVAAPETSDYFRRVHRDHGVVIREKTGLTRLIGTDRVAQAELGDGTVLDVDLVIVGVGIVPDVALAEAAGLTVENGIVVDNMGRSSDPAIWAAGDCAIFPGPEGPMRLESVQNAIDQAEAVADNMMGAEAPYAPKPWFWSDQYDVKLQIAGLNSGYDRIVRRGTADEGTLSFWYYRGDRLIAVDALNDSRAYMVGKRLIESGKSPNPEAVTNPETDLKALLKA
ncbi:MAG: NAD(P)/FAD-dependent oxidoreductase [Qingshengfaniella sp.]